MFRVRLFSLSFALLGAWLPNALAQRAGDNEQTVSAILSTQGRVDAVVMDERERPAFIRGDFDYSKYGNNPQEIAYAYFEKNISIYHMESPRTELNVRKIDTDEQGVIHVSFGQVFHDVPVYLGELKVHVDRADHITAVNGSYFDNITVNTQPGVNSSAAQSSILKHLNRKASECSFSAEALSIGQFNNAYHLAWRIQVEVKNTIEKWEYFVDAHTGDVVHRNNLIIE